MGDDSKGEGVGFEEDGHLALKFFWNAPFFHFEHARAMTLCRPKVCLFYRFMPTDGSTLLVNIFSVQYLV